MGTKDQQDWYCRTCGGNDIRHDAITQWDPATQAWKVLDVLDDEWCETCQTAGNDGEPVFGVMAETSAEEETA